MGKRGIVNLLAAGICFGVGACHFEAEDHLPTPMLTNEERTPTPTFSIGGSVAGSSGTIVLQNSNGTNLIVTRDGSFTFETPMVSSAIYNVTVAVAPNLQTCVVAKGAGTVAHDNISDVTVTCTSNSYMASNTVAGDFP